MSHGEEFWKWDDAEKRISFARRLESPRIGCAQTGSDMREGGMDGLVAHLETELRITRRLLDAKSLECARLQKAFEDGVKAAFYEGFWAWNGPANDAEFDRDIKLCDEAWETYSVARMQKELEKVR